MLRQRIRERVTDSVSRTISAALCFLVSASVVLGQTLTSLTGAVSDPTGAAIPSATISITNVGTNQVRDVKSDD